MNTSILTSRTGPQSESTTVSRVEKTASRVAHSRRTISRRVSAVLLVFAFAIAAALAPIGSASATQRLGNGSFGNYGLECGYHSAQLTVQGGANGISLNGFKYWIYSVDHGQYIINGSWVPMAAGWTTKSVSIVRAPGRYKVYVEYWSNTGGQWYAAGEWAWAQNLVHGTQSLTCRVT